MTTVTTQATMGSATRVVVLTFIVGVFFTAQDVLLALANGHPASAARDLRDAPLFWGVWAFLAPAVTAAVRRWPVDVKPIGRALAAHAATAFALATLQSLVTLALQALVAYAAHRVDGRGAVALVADRSALVWGVFTGVFLYAVVVMVYAALRFRGLYAAEQLSAAQLASRGAALEAELARSKLEALRSQLRPHFLFNTLNAIATLLTEDPSSAKRMLLRLASLLRRSLDEEAHEIPLRQELAFLSDYLDIQRARFGDRLDVSVDVRDEALDARIPVLLLQPIVENAIEHGESPSGRTTVVLRATRDGERLHLTVEDAGPGMSPAGPVREGVGLRNTRARLHHLYGPGATLELRSVRSAQADREPSGLRVDVILPFAPAGARGPA